MRLKSLLAAGLTLAALTLPTGAVMAQDASSSQAPAAAPTADSKATPAQNWRKTCMPIADGKRSCSVQQVVLTPNQQFLGSFVIREDPSQDSSRLMIGAQVPLQVLLPPGITLQIDGNKPYPIPFMQCNPEGCATWLAVNDLFVNSLKQGSKLTVTARNRKNQLLDITFNLAGFTAAFDDQTTPTSAGAAPAGTGMAPLEKILQDRAEAARQKLQGGDASTPAPGTQDGSSAQ